MIFNFAKLSVIFFFFFYKLYNNVFFSIEFITEIDKFLYTCRMHIFYVLFYHIVQNTE